MQVFETPEYGLFYHIYNHGVGGRDLFLDANNYEYFLGLYDKYISPIADTYAWCLMPNHFHLLVRIKEEVEIVEYISSSASASSTPDRVRNPVRGKTDKNIVSNQFSKLFNAYAQACNKYHKTRGVLFERPFKRKRIDNEHCLKQVVLYIHNNPVHHGFCKHPLEYAWCSYLTCISVKPTKLHRETVIGWFGNEANFKYLHDTKIDTEEIEGWLGE